MDFLFPLLSDWLTGTWRDSKVFIECQLNASCFQFMSQYPPSETATGFVLEIVWLQEQKLTQRSKSRRGFIRRLQRTIADPRVGSVVAMRTVPSPGGCEHALLCPLVYMYSLQCGNSRSRFCLQVCMTLLLSFSK